MKSVIFRLSGADATLSPGRPIPEYQYDARSGMLQSPVPTRPGLTQRNGARGAPARYCIMQTMRRAVSAPLPGAAAFRRIALLVTLSAATLAGCQTLLPDASDATQVEWRSFDEAREAIEAIEPFSTRKSVLIESGFDPRRNPAVTILTYPEIVQRFSAGSALRPDEYEPGIRTCLAAGKECSGYAVAVRKIKRDRIGNFWLDSFAFRRETNITGWIFNGLILFVDDLVVYTVFGGQPSLHELQVTRNPLGPLQGWGEALRPHF